jgi:hypothetical protein
LAVLGDKLFGIASGWIPVMVGVVFWGMHIFENPQAMRSKAVIGLALSMMGSAGIGVWLGAYDLASAYGVLVVVVQRWIDANAFKQHENSGNEISSFADTLLGRIWIRIQIEIGILRLASFVNLLTSRAFHKELRASIISISRISSIRQPVTIVMDPRVFLDAVPKEFKPRGYPVIKPWQMTYTYGEDFQALLLQYGNHKYPKVNITMGPVDYKEASAQQNELLGVFTMGRTFNDTNTGEVFYDSGNIYVLAKPGANKQTVLAQLSYSLAST